MLGIKYSSMREQTTERNYVKKKRAKSDEILENSRKSIKVTQNKKHYTHKHTHLHINTK